MSKFAVFDIDGTLIRWQLYHVVVDRLAKLDQLSSGAEDRLKSARMRWKKRQGSNSFAEYETELISIFEQSIKDVDPKIFDKLVSDIIDEYKDQVYVFTRDLIKTLKTDGYKLLAISGSHHELVSEIARAYEFDDWQGTEYVRKNNKFSGESYVASFQKKAILEDMIKKHHLNYEKSYAIGDSASDIPMLKMVERPIAFNPNQELYEKAKQNGWQIVIERKNVIYKLEKSDGKYTLL